MRLRARRPAVALTAAGLISAAVVGLGTGAAFAGTDDFKVVFQTDDDVLGGYSLLVAAHIAALADANVGKGAGTCSSVNSSLNSLGGSAFYSSCTGNGGSAEYWCSDFAEWVWADAGVNVSGISPASASFIYDASDNGSTVHTAASYAPQVGDAVVYDWNGADYGQGFFVG